MTAATAKTPQLPLTESVRILRADPCGLIALDKPYGLMSHPNKESDKKDSGSGDGPSLLDAPYDHKNECYHWTDAAGQQRRAWLLHRLDSPTSGVILISTDEDVARRVKDLFLRKRVLKIYQAVVIGRPPPLPHLWVDHLTKVQRGKGVRMVAGNDLEARTRMRIRRNDANGVGLTLIELEPLSGRTHQLRVQCASRGYPIVGDRNYGRFSANRQIAEVIGTRRLFLHSLEVRLQLSLRGKTIAFSVRSEPPEVFARIVNPDTELRKLKLKSGRKN